MTEVEVPFAAGGRWPEREQLAQAYLSVLAAATGRPELEQEPVYTVETEWSDYDYPSEHGFYLWGNGDYGLKLITSTQYVQHGRPAGWLGFWVFLGTRGLSGQSKFHIRWQSYAQLKADEAAWCELFESQLAEWDQRRQSEGPARAALERFLTRHCWYGVPLNELEIEQLEAALSSSQEGSPVFHCGQFLLAACLAAREQPEKAARQLELVGETWAYGMACRYEHGRPAGLVWQDEFEPPAPRLQRLLLDYALTGRAAALQELDKTTCPMARQGLASLKGSA